MVAARQLKPSMRAAHSPTLKIRHPAREQADGVEANLRREAPSAHGLAERSEEAAEVPTWSCAETSRLNSFAEGSPRQSCAEASNALPARERPQSETTLGVAATPSHPPRPSRAKAADASGQVSYCENAAAQERKRAQEALRLSLHEQVLQRQQRREEERRE